MNYETLAAENKELYSQLERITGLTEAFKKEFEKLTGIVNTLKKEREAILKKIDNNLDWQSIYWPGMEDEELHPKSSMVAEWMENPDLTLTELSKKHGVHLSTLSEKITKALKLKSA